MDECICVAVNGIARASCPLCNGTGVINHNFRKVEHGIEAAYYSGGPRTSELDPYFMPTLECQCGYKTGRQESWQAAGKLLDEHLASVKP